MALQGCENPSGCRKVAIRTFVASDGSTEETTSLCAYCSEAMLSWAKDTNLTVREVSQQ